MGLIKKLFLIFTVQGFFLETIYGQTNNRCFRDDYTCLPKTKSYYKIHTTPRNWFEARKECVSEGSSLWYAEDQVEANAVIRFWTQTKQNIASVFVGITDLISKSVYETIDGRPIEDIFNFWSEGEPNDGNGEERCVVLRREIDLNDYRCIRKFPFICSKKLDSISGCDNPGDKNCFREDYTYLDSTKTYYKLHSFQRNWFDAKKECKKEGAALWYPEDKSEANTIAEFWTKTHSDFHWVFIGISDLLIKGLFETVDGRPLQEVFHEWAPGEPNDGGNNGGEERCLMIRREGTLDDHRCNMKFPFICKKTLHSLVKNHTCTGADVKDCFRPDYTYLESMKSFYKLHKIQRNWFDAKSQCTSEGAKFWYADNQDEVNAVTSFWKQIEPNFIWVFVGISDLVVKGQYETIDGRTIDEVFNMWSENEPNDGNAQERCVILKREGNINDHRCHMRFPFICRKKFDSSVNRTCDNPNDGNCFRRDYTYLPRTNSFYKIHTLHRTWFDAKAECLSEGASLWYPEDQIEVNAVIAYWSRTTPGFEWVFIGVSDLIEKGSFETIDGRPIEDVFHYWAPGEPNDGWNNAGEERCLILRREGSLDDHRCSVRFPFICRKKFDSSDVYCNCENNAVSRPQWQQNTWMNRPSQSSTQPQDIISSITTSVQCGVFASGNDRQPLIFHGQTYPRGEWPWVAAIFKKREASLSFICSGTLVSDRHVITAAHCMHVRNSLTMKKDIVVKVGVYNLDDWGDDITVSRNVASATIHEGYNSSTLANDILVLTLERSVEFNSNIRPACLWSGNPELNIIVGATGVVSGWGLSEIGPEGRGEPRFARLPVVSTSACRASRPDFHKLTSEFTLCAGDRNGVGPCLGDSGGGFYMIEKGRWQLRGIVSLSLRSDDGDRSCNLNEYIVFTDAAKYVNWIRSVISG